MTTKKSRKNFRVRSITCNHFLEKLKKFQAHRHEQYREIGDFIQKNKFYQGFWRPEVQKEVINITKREEAERLEKAVRSKEEQEEIERKKKYFFIHKWSLIKSKVITCMLNRTRNKKCFSIN